MIRWLLIALAIAAVLYVDRAHAQTAQTVSSCGTAGPAAGWPLGTVQNLSMTQTGELCISGTINASSAANATSTLPTLSAGSQSFQQSLGGGLYVQPIFGSASGGGTQVSLSNGLPVDIVAGGGSGGTASSFAATFPGTGTAAGLEYLSSAPTYTTGDMEPFQSDIHGNLLVNLNANSFGTLTVGGTVTANAGTNLNTSALATAANQEVTAAGSSATSAQGVQGVTGGVALPTSLASLPSLAAGSNTIGAVTQASGPWTNNVTQWDSTALGAPSAYGTSPGAVNVPGVNAYVTNTPAVSQSGSPWGVNVTQIGSSASGVTTWGTAPTGASVLNANVNCLSGCGGSGGTSLSDEGTFTQGSTAFTPIGGYYNTSITNLTSGEGGSVRLLPDRSMFANMDSWAGAALGAPSNYGTSPGAVEVPGVNAFITNTPAVSQSGTWTMQPGNTANTTPWLFTPYQNSADLFPNAAALADAASNPTTTGLGSYNLGYNGSTWDRLRDDTNKYLYVDVGVALPAGSNTIGNVNPGTAANWGIGATGSGLPANAVYGGVNTDNALSGLHVCGSYAFATISSATNTQLVALSSGHNIYVCGIEDFASAADNLYLESATSASCGGTLTQIMATRYDAATGGETAPSPAYRGINTGSGNALCVNTSTSGPAGVGVYYDQY